MEREFKQLTGPPTNITGGGDVEFPIPNPNVTMTNWVSCAKEEVGTWIGLYRPPNEWSHNGAWIIPA